MTFDVFRSDINVLVNFFSWKPAQSCVGHDTLNINVDTTRAPHRVHLFGFVYVTKEKKNSD